MATEIRDDLRGRKEAAVQLLREALDTPYLIEMEFTLRVGVDMADEAEYTIRRFVDPAAAAYTGRSEDNGEGV